MEERSLQQHIVVKKGGISADGSERAFPAKDYSVATERWTRIAAAVPGTNTPQQCQRKAAELAKAIKAKKAAAGTS